ncbi:amino acid adenylation domain-containing protein [Nonomuraea sp. NPDC046570]|uniref:non-ribosomal peptide synthetase n=1 Tax=Nonomuraea sp. NPDC046570 TaxID=3155255 RepID=UPI0033F80E8B
MPHVDDAYPLTRLQAGMLFHSWLDAGLSTYHDLSSLRVQGPFDADALRGVLAMLAEGHDVLRTSVDLTRFSEPMQLVHVGVQIPLTVADLRRLDPARQEEDVETWRRAERAREFDLAVPPLLSVHVQQLGETDFWLNLSFHHAILDGWSLSLLTSQLLREYDRALGGHAADLNAPATSFHDYVLLEHAALADEQAGDYWRQLLRDTAIAELPRWGGTVAARSAHVHKVPLPEGLTERVRALAAQARVTTKAVLFAAHAAVLSRVTGQDRVVTGRVTNGRPETPNSDQMIGIFLNVVPMALTTRDTTWLELAQQAHQAEIESMPFRRYPFSQMLRDTDRPALFETLVDYRNMRSYGGLTFEHLAVVDTEFFEQTNFAFTANYGVDPATGDLRLRINHDEAEISATQIETIGGYYTAAFEAMLADPQAPVTSAWLLSPEELDRQLVTWNATAVDLPPHPVLPELLFKADPDRVAIRFEERRLSYAEVHTRADRLAVLLRERGVRPGVMVGIHMRRSPELVLALLGVLKAGGSYLPLDPAYPRDRLAFMLADSGTGLVLADDDPGFECEHLVIGPHNLDGGPVDEPEHEAAPDDLAYVIYTSGSTGRPKGVQVTHKALVNLLLSMAAEVGLTDADRWLALTSVSFDIAGLELFAPLLTGGELVLIPDTATDGTALLKELEDVQPTIVQATPSSWKLLVEAGMGERPGMRALCGGEAMPADLAAQLASRLGAVWNVYGPTETTIWSTLDRVEADGPVTIGRPLANTQVYVLDHLLRPVPLGAPGELYLGGDGMARGYLGRPGLTAQRFVASEWGRLFRTGDTVRWRTDGRLEFLGRNDYQVKVRGYRIELGEIETVLVEHGTVTQAAVMPRQDRLVAYVVGTAPAPAQLRAHAASRVPEYMVPAAFVVMDAFPLTPNGKVDRKALPDPGRTDAAASVFVPPVTETERLVSAIWAKELGLDRVGSKDAFRDLGGHSIAALRIALGIKEATGVEISIARLLTEGSVAALAEVIDSGRTVAGSVLVPLCTRGERTPLFLVHPLGGSVFCYLDLIDELPDDQPVYAFQAFDLAGPDGPRPETLEEMAGLYLREVRAVQPHGPYRLGGWCLGGAVAYEMARQVQAAGEEVELLALFSSSILDPVPPEYAMDESVAMLGAFGDHLPITLEELRAIEPPKRFDHVINLAQGDLARPDVNSADDLRRLVGAFQRHARAVLAYRDTPRTPYQGPMLMVRAESGHYPGDLGWGPRVDGHLAIVDSPGTHGEMLQRPNAASVAGHLLRATEHGEQR